MNMLCLLFIAGLIINMHGWQLLASCECVYGMNISIEVSLFPSAFNYSWLGKVDFAFKVFHILLLKLHSHISSLHLRFCSLRMRELTNGVPQCDILAFFY